MACRPTSLSVQLLTIHPSRDGFRRFADQLNRGIERHGQLVPK
jgi:hypothetical protein